MRGAKDPERSARGRVAAVALGALLTAASMAPATAAQADATTTVQGTVQVGRTALAGVPVGFWSRTGHRLAATTTGTSGAFTLHVPSGVRGFAYAGTLPDAATAVFALNGRSYVRGVIGATQGSTTSYRIYQGHASATAANLAGGRSLHFRLQKPGRISIHGRDYFKGSGDAVGVVQLLRLNGSLVDEYAAEASTGIITTPYLVPGRYRLHSFPQPPYLRTTVGVTVYPGGVTTLSPEFVRGATVSGRITSGGEAVAGVNVSLWNSPAKGGSATTDGEGRYTIRTLAAGKYTMTVGRNDQGDPEDLPDDPSEIPPPSSDDYLVATSSVTVDAAHHDRTKDLTLSPAGHLTGTVVGSGARRVYVEDSRGRSSASGSPIRAGTRSAASPPAARTRCSATSTATTGPRRGTAR